MEKVDIKITLSGDRACGKTVMAVFLKTLFESLGAEVEMSGYDFQKYKNISWHKINMQEILKMPKRFDKSRIIIHENMSKQGKDTYDIAIKNLKILSGQ